MSLTLNERSVIILNMYSALPGAGDDRTARARIRDAAITRFADHGVAGTSVRAIAEDAGVSPALVIHHFGSKDALRVACDQHVAALIRERKLAAVKEGSGFDPLAAMQANDGGPPYLKYLARTLADGTPQVVELVDGLIADARKYMAAGVASGMLKPSEHAHGRAVVLTIWSLGALVLHEHLDRHLGTDLTKDGAGMVGYAVPATEILARGVLTEAMYERVKNAQARAEERTS